MPQAATIGRVVWVWVSEADADEFNILDEQQALRADVIYVHPNGAVDLSCTDHHGEIGTVSVGPIQDPDDDAHGHQGDTYASWMPYQKAQHDKQAAG